MRAAITFIVAALYFQWLSPFSQAMPMAPPTPPVLEACQSYEFYDSTAMNVSFDYAVCKDVILQPGNQLPITTVRGQAKYMVFKNNILPILPLETFTGLPNLTRIYLNRNGMKTILPGLFTSLEELQELHLQDNSLTEISTGTFTTLKNLMILDLSNNAIKNLVTDCLAGLNNLRNLNLNRNRIYYLDREVFLALTQLEILDLSHNYLSASEQFVVIEIQAQNLKNLLINNNLLERFPILFTEKVNCLELLDVSFNALTDIDFGSIPVSKIANFSNNEILIANGFSEFYNASVIDLHSNKIKYNIKINKGINQLDLRWNELEILNTFVFDRSADLVTLDLGHNFIKQITENIFHGLTKLEILRLNNNTITYLYIDCFFGLHSLDILSLSHNSLKMVENGVFNGLSQLTTLCLDNNKLVYINKHAFLDLFKLQSLYLNNNLLTTMDVEFLLENLPYLNRLSLSNNIWDCSNLITASSTAFREHALKMSTKNDFDLFNAFELACDTFHLKVYLQKVHNDPVVEYFIRSVTSLMLLFLLIFDLIIVGWYILYIRLRSQVKRTRIQFVVTKRKLKNTDIARNIVF